LPRCTRGQSCLFKKILTRVAQLGVCCRPGECHNRIQATLLMAAVHIVSAGYDSHLMQTRSLVLRHSGFVVDEAYNPWGVLGVIKAGSVDAVVLCHTIPKDEQRRLILSIRKLRCLLPIISIEASIYDSPQEDCLRSTNEPDYLLATIGKAIHRPQAPVGLPRAIPKVS
jgi:hypothetical protein